MQMFSVSWSGTVLAKEIKNFKKFVYSFVSIVLYILYCYYYSYFKKHITDITFYLYISDINTYNFTFTLSFIVLCIIEPLF